MCSYLMERPAKQARVHSGSAIASSSSRSRSRLFGSHLPESRQLCRQILQLSVKSGILFLCHVELLLVQLELFAQRLDLNAGRLPFMFELIFQGFFGLMRRLKVGDIRRHLVTELHHGLGRLSMAAQLPFIPATPNTKQITYFY